MSSIGLVLRDRYEFVAELGRGGMSAVYLARDLNLDSYWAVKQVKNNSSVEFEAFKKEVELLSTLSHPDIPRIVDRIEIEDNYYVVMDFIDGTSLSKLVLATGPQPEKLVVEWGKNLCDVLEYLHTVHAHPIIYRDLKPDNVMLSQSGRIKLIDFGIAKEIPHGQKLEGENIGTKGYAAPEQYQGASNMLDERTDIYCLGATLFYLATGVVPQKPPKGVPALRQIAPQQSEGLEYIVAKCTADAPEDRYQSIAEVRSDFENIAQLTHSYRSRMSRRLGAFVACLSLSLVFALVGFVGFRGVKADLESTYQGAFQAATAADRSGDYSTAAEYYSKAIEAKPGDRETYIKFLNAILPKAGDEDATEGTKAAIDEFCMRYVDNEQSPMYHDARLMYQIIRRCIEVEDPEYAQRALEYTGYIYNSAEFRDETFSAREIQSFEVIASYLAQDATSQDFSSFQEALTNLEEYTDASTLTADERLSNYYILIRMYSTYPTSLENAYGKAYEIGHKAKTILESNMSDENMAFSNIIPMYELVASGQYNNAFLQTRPHEKEQAYLNCIEWFGYLDDLDIELSETMAIRRGRAHKGIFDLYDTIANYGDMPAEAITALNTAIECFEEAINEYPDSFLAHLYLTHAYLDVEVMKPENEQDFSRVMELYRRVQQLKTNDLSNNALSQFSGLKTRMQNLGLEV